MATSVDNFLAGLRNNGRITNLEYLNAYVDESPLSEGLVKVSSPVSRRHLQVIHRVLNNVGLLKLILDHLSPAEQLRAQVICRGFQKIIERSPSMAVRGSRRQECKTSILLPPYNIRGIHMSATRARGVPGISVVLDLGVHSVYYKRVLRRSATLRRTLIAQPAPSRARLSADCRCEISRTWLFDNREGITFGDMFNAVDGLGGHRCKDCWSKYYIRISNSRGGV